MASTLSDLRARVDGRVISPDDPCYQTRRQVWNGMIDKHPALIVECKSTRDVVEALAYARREELPLSVRGTGHHIAGKSVCEGGLVVDLSTMRGVRVDPDAARVHVDAGATLGDVDATTLVHGLVVPTGMNSTTGIAGLTLGGGLGWLTRSLGMTVDSLIGAEVVTADGQVLDVNAESHPDLLWALQGGGGNFGVVTRFDFALHRVEPELLCGVILYPLEHAENALQRYRELVAEAPNELALWCVLRGAPGLDFVNPSAVGRPCAVFLVVYNGDPQQGLRKVEALTKLEGCLGHNLDVRPFVHWQQAFDGDLVAGARNYWKSHYLERLDDGLIAAALEQLAALPGPQCEVFLGPLGGVASEPAPESTAYAHRSAQFVMNIHGRWEHPDQDEVMVEWTRAAFQAFAPFATGGVYVNFVAHDADDTRTRSAFGANYERLAQIKARYDPNNVFSSTQNVLPE